MMSGWGIADTASKIEKIKAESADYLHGLDSCGKIEWSTYSDAFDFYEDLIEKAYTQGKEDAQPEIKTDGDTISRAAAIDILYNFAGCIADTPGDWYKAFEKYKYDLENLPSAQPERKTGRMSNKDWINFLCEQFDISRTSARDMLHGMMNYKKEDNFKRLFNPTQREGEG